MVVAVRINYDVIFGLLCKIPLVIILENMIDFDGEYRRLRGLTQSVLQGLQTTQFFAEQL